ncbi:VanZ family protein [uncultured Microbacterium sp.]|uniref:VanZ family protein n=1 Tax=uncultured Microbacterium sp. TaxID=191216 RepID=UPI0028E7E210|nr:VanZ family protein [uncultured Microbacterium sp.]
MPVPATARARSRAMWARGGLVAYFLFVAFIVWLPAAIAGKMVGVVVLGARWTAQRGIASYEVSFVSLEFLANVLFLVPVGALIALGWQRLRLWHVVLIGFLMSGLIESVQAFVPTRAPSLSDVVANTLGTLIGAAVVAAIPKRGRRGDGAASAPPGHPRPQ